MPSFLQKLDDLLARYLAYFNYKNYVNHMNLRGNERILEIGCGGGNLSRFLAESLPLGELVCIDISEYWIKKAENRLKKYKNIRFQTSDIMDFNKKDYFDIAVLHYILHDIPKEKRADAVKVLGRGLKNKSKIYIREPIRENHGIPSEETKILMEQENFLESASKEGYSFPIRGKIYEGVFER